MRQLLVSNGVAVSYTDNVLASGALDIVKRTADGFVSLAAGETIADSDEIRFVQGTPEGKNLFSPWIPGTAISGWTGASYSAQVPQITTSTVLGPAVADANINVKIVNLNGGQAQFKRKNWTVPILAGDTAIQVCDKIKVAIAADPADFATESNVTGTATLIFTGNVFNIANSTELTSFRTAFEGFDGSNGLTVSVAATGTGPILGAGDGNVLFDYEKTLKGDRSYYNRIFLPNTPPSYVNVATEYDVYTLAFKNPAEGQIRGVDNLREISIAFDSDVAPTIAAVKTAFEAQINPYVTSTPGTFPAVTL